MRKEQIIKTGITLLLLSIAFILIAGKGCPFKKKKDDDDVITGSSATLPGQATSPNPADGATDVSPTPTLTWVAANGATNYNVNFGTTTPPLFAINTTQTNYAPGTLNYSTTYYWWICPANNYGSVASDIWSFQTEAWTRQFGTTAEDVAYGVATDTSGNIYVVGYTLGDMGDVITNTGGTDLFVVKYNPAGVKQWTRQFGTTDEDVAYGVATDTSGNVYVAGGTLGDLDGNPNAGRYDLFVIKYDTDGVKQWTRQLGSPADDGALGVAIDTNGKIYVAGNRGFDTYVVKYNSAGGKNWARKFGTPGWDYAWDVATDTSNNIYAAGLTYGDLGDVNPNAGGFDLFVLKYNSAGVRQWTRQLGTAETDKAYGVATDTSGNVYAVGETQGDLDGNPNAGGFDLFVVKYDTDGVKQWTRQLGTADRDEAHGVATDTSDNIYVVGATKGDLGDVITNAGGFDLFVVKYDTDGVKQWTRQLGTADDDKAFGVATDTSDNIYVVGWTEGGLNGNTNAGGRDIFVVKYNSAGVKQ